MACQVHVGRRHLPLYVPPSAFFFVSDLAIDEVADILGIFFLVLEAYVLAQRKGAVLDYGKH